MLPVAPLRCRSPGRTTFWRLLALVADKTVRKAVATEHARPSARFSNLASYRRIKSLGCGLQSASPSDSLKPRSAPPIVYPVDAGITRQ